jgi:hypothetical protein
VAVATLWMVSVGGALEVETLPAGTAIPDRRPLLGATGQMPGRRRLLRLMRLGWVWCLVCQITTGGLPLPQPFVPEPWPEMPRRVLITVDHQNPLQESDIWENLPP